MKRFALFAASFVACGLLIWLGLNAFAADVPTGGASVGMAHLGPGTQPAVRLPAPLAVGSDRTLPMPRVYLVLLTRSMFVRGHVADVGHAGGHNAARPTGPANTAPAQERAETGLVFNGLTKTTTSIEALVEDTSTGRVMTVHTGDALARGTVGRITMDTLEYVNNGNVTPVRIGQNLTGADGDVSASPATSEPAISGASPQDILERLRQKRLQELGGGK